MPTGSGPGAKTIRKGNLFLLMSLNLLLSLLERPTDSWNLNKKAENPDNQRDNNRCAKYAAQTEKYAAEKVHLVNVPTVIVKVIEQLFQKRPTGADALIA